jgi:hypothetical protein
MNINANATENSVQLLSGEDLLSAGQAVITEGLTAASAGTILYPDQVLSVTVPEASKETPADPRISEWSKAYRFIIIPVAVAIQTKPGTAPQSVVINATFRNSGQTTKQPIIIDVFPATGFKPGPLTGSASASVGIGSNLKFGGGLPVNADASVKAALTYNYAPGFANVESGYASTACFWQFAATQSEQPVGSLSLKLTVAVPRNVTVSSIALAFDIVASFGGSWFGNDVRASFVAEVLLPPAE